MSLLSLPARWLLLSALIAASGLYGWTRGATHAEHRLEAYVQAVESAADRQTVRVRLLESRQRSISKEVQHETVSRIARSDDYYRLRWPTDRRGALSAIPGSAVPALGPAPESALDSAGNPGGAFCADPADSSADAIVILEWQRWYLRQKAAHDEVMGRSSHAWQSSDTLDTPDKGHDHGKEK